MATNIKDIFFKTLLLFIMVSTPALPGCSSNDHPDPLPPRVDETANEWVIYEVYPGLFEHRNAFNAIADRLDDIADLGVNVIWLMPIYEQGVENAFGSPYSVKDYKKVNADYGTLEELKSLVAKARSKNMKVILDWVANHTSWDNAWIQNKEWYPRDASGNIVSPPGMNWADVADLDYANREMRNAMLDAMEYWVTEVGVDGYRCDYAEGVPGDFWEEAISALKAIKKEELVMLAEGGDVSLLSHGFDILYGWNNNPSYTSAYKKIMDVYTSSNALRKGTLRTFNTGDVATFLRVSQDEALLIMVNPTNDAKEAKVPIEFAREDAFNLINNTSSTLPPVITLEPYQYTILKVK